MRSVAVLVMMSLVGSVSANGPGRFPVGTRTTVSTTRTVTTVRTPRVNVNVGLQRGVSVNVGRSFGTHHHANFNRNVTFRQRGVAYNAGYATRGFSGYAGATTYVAPPASYPSTTYAPSYAPSYAPTPNYAPACDTCEPEPAPAPAPAPTCNYTPVPTYTPPVNYGCGGCYGGCVGNAPAYYAPPQVTYVPAPAPSCAPAVGYSAGYSFGPSYSYSPGVRYYTKAFGTGVEYGRSRFFTNRGFFFRAGNVRFGTRPRAFFSGRSRAVFSRGIY